MNFDNITYEQALECDLLQEDSLWIRIKDSGRDLSGEIISITKIIKNNDNDNFQIDFNRYRGRPAYQFIKYFKPYNGSMRKESTDIKYLQNGE